MTNLEFFRTAEPEEIAKFLRRRVCDCPETANDLRCGFVTSPIAGGGKDCSKCWLDWLKAEAKS